MSSRPRVRFVGQDMNDIGILVDNTMAEHPSLASDSSRGLEQLTKPLFRVLSNQFEHSLFLVLVPALELWQTCYLWHQWLSIFAFDVSERHLRALVLIYLQLWMVYVRDPVERRLQKVMIQSEL